MPADTDGTGSPGEWMRHAAADLAIARIPLPAGALYEQLCFHAQQAAEKALKAVLVHLAIDFPYTHSLETLVDLLPSEVARTPTLTAAARLTDHAAISRYPRAGEPVEEEEYREALRLAEAVVAWAEERLQAEAAE